MFELLRREVIFYLKSKCIQVKEEIFIIQKAYIQNILITFGMKNCKSKIILIDEKLKLKFDIDKKEVDFIQYHNIIRKYLHLSTLNLIFNFKARVVNRFMARPQKSHLFAAKRILHYIKHIEDYGILYKNKN